MRYIKTYIPAAVLIGGLLALSASAQEAAVVPTPTGPTHEVDTPPTPGTPEHAAQIKREHERAVVSGDRANDPLNSASSNALNQQEAGKAAILGNDPVPADKAASPPPAPHPNLTDPSGDTAGTLPVDPNPTQAPPPADKAPPAAGESLKPDTATVK